MVPYLEALPTSDTIYCYPSMALPSICVSVHADDDSGHCRGSSDPAWEKTGRKCGRQDRGAVEMSTKCEIARGSGPPLCSRVHWPFASESAILPVAGGGLTQINTDTRTRLYPPRKQDIPSTQY